MHLIEQFTHDIHLLLDKIDHAVAGNPTPSGTDTTADGDNTSTPPVSGGTP